MLHERPRRNGRWVALLVGLLLTNGYTRAFGQSGIQSAAERLRELDRDRLAASQPTDRAKFTPAYINRTLAAIEPTLNEGIVSFLDRHPTPSSEQLEEKLRRSLTLTGEPDSNVASVFSFRDRHVSGFVVGYALIGAITSSRSWIGVFGSETGDEGYRLLAGDDNSLPDRTMGVVRIESLGETDLTFAAYGINWGDAHNRLTAIVYRLRNHALEPIWTRRELPEGDLKAEGAKLVLKYYNRLTQPTALRTEVYEFDPVGGRLIDSSDEPLQ